MQDRMVVQELDVTGHETHIESQFGIAG